MARYIELDALVAEIERRYETILIGAHSAFKNGKIEALREVKDFLNTLEVKEVNLEKEIANQYESNYEDYLTYEEFADIAKHFFELGLKAQKGEKV